MMKNPDTPTLVRAWINYHEHPNRQGDLFWAWETVSDTVAQCPEEGWRLILELIQNAPDKLILANIAAGPLEDLIVQHGPIFIDRIEDLARKDPRFRIAVTGVWCEGDIPVDIHARICLYTSSVPDPL